VVVYVFFADVFLINFHLDYYFVFIDSSFNVRPLVAGTVGEVSSMVKAFIYDHGLTVPLGAYRGGLP
jgi:hypothetical protein